MKSYDYCGHIKSQQCTGTRRKRQARIPPGRLLCSVEDRRFGYACDFYLMEGEGNVLHRNALSNDQARDTIRIIGELVIGMHGVPRINTGTIIYRDRVRLDFQGTHDRDGITEANLQVQLNVPQGTGQRFHFFLNMSFLLENLFKIRISRSNPKGNYTNMYILHSLTTES
jgi:hypothetical protein